MKPNRLPREFGKLFGLFALGAAAGSLCGLLLAPASGRVTRKRIAMKFKSLEQEGSRQIKQAKKLLAKKAEDLRDAASEKLSQTKEWLVERVVSGNGKHPSHRRLVHHA